MSEKANRSDSPQASSLADAGGAKGAKPVRFSGYYAPKDRPCEDETARVGPGTPGGEYMRRFWHPIIMSSQIGELAQSIRVLGEDSRHLPEPVRGHRVAAQALRTSRRIPRVRHHRGARHTLLLPRVDVRE